MQIVIDFPNPPSEQSIINVPIHFCGGQVVDAGGYGFEERKTGKWLYDIQNSDAIEAMFTLPKCNICGAETSHAKAMYCPNCGAKMEGAGGMTEKEIIDLVAERVTEAYSRGVKDGMKLANDYNPVTVPIKEITYTPKPLQEPPFVSVYAAPPYPWYNNVSDSGTTIGGWTIQGKEGEEK